MNEFFHVLINIVLFYFVSFFGYKYWSFAKLKNPSFEDFLKGIGWILLVWSVLGAFAIWN